MNYISLFVLALTFPNLTLAEGNATVGTDKAVICAGCHGMDGNSDNAEYPIIAGQHQSYLKKQIRDFKSGLRQDYHMTAMVEAIDTVDIPDITAYFSSQKRKKTNSKNEVNQYGYQIYNIGIIEKGVTACIFCHEINGVGNAIEIIPALATQHTGYLSKALKDFRSADRHNDPGKVMRSIASKLNDGEIKAVSRYISTLK